MINEIAMALMFVVLFILLLSAVIVGSRVKKTKTQEEAETLEEPPEEALVTQKPLSEEPSIEEVEQIPVSIDVVNDSELRQSPPEPEIPITEHYVDVPEPELEIHKITTEPPESDIEEPLPEVSVLEVPEPDIEEILPEIEVSVLDVPEPDIEESLPEMDEDMLEVTEPEIVLPEPIVIETTPSEELILDETTYEDEYREPDYFKDEDVSPIQGVTTCPHCGEKVPATLYCINCGKSLNG